MATVVVTGATGLLGRAVHGALVSSLPSAAVSVIGLCHTRTRPLCQPCNLIDPASVQVMLDQLQPALIVHCAAERRPDVVELQPKIAYRLNVGVTEQLAAWAEKTGCCLLFVSSDYVFDGRAPPYDESAIPNPLNTYGRHKLEGERAVLRVPQNIVLRVPILYGDVEYLDESAVTVLFKKVLDGSQPATMCHYQRRFPTHVNDVAALIADVVKRKLKIQPDQSHPDISGVLHFSAHEEMTKFEMAVTMARVLGLSAGHLTPDDQPSSSGTTDRPHNPQLAAPRLQELGLTEQGRAPLISFDAGIRDSLAKFMPKH